jgi:hypothetical protein
MLCTVLPMVLKVKLLTSSRMLADVEYFNSRISKLEGAGDLGGHVVNVVQAKAIISESGAAAKRSSIEKPQEEKAPPAPAASNTETS